MKTTLIKFPAISFRKVYGSEGADDQLSEASTATKTGQMYSAVIKVTNLPNEFSDWLGINPRVAKTTSGVAIKIKDTLCNDPDWFLFKNRGLTVLAEKVTFDNKNNEVQIEFSEANIHGLLDGGHTFRVIQEFLEGLDEDEKKDYNALIKLEVLVGVNDIESAVKIVEARNTSTQVKAESIEELKKQYEEIKRIISAKPYAEKISYKENELDEEGVRKSIDIKEVLSYIVCFDTVNFDDRKHPIKAYSSKAAVVEHFKDNKDKLIKFIPLLPEILELRDVIYAELPEAYNHTTNGKFGKITGVLELSNKKRIQPEILPFTEIASNYRIPMSFIYPTLSAFRNLVDCSDDKCKWKADPIKLFREIKGELSSRIGGQAKELRNPTKMGKDQATWQSCYDLLQLEVLKRHL